MWHHTGRQQAKIIIGDFVVHAKTLDYYSRGAVKLALYHQDQSILSFLRKVEWVVYTTVHYCSLGKTLYSTILGYPMHSFIQHNTY